MISRDIIISVIDRILDAEDDDFEDLVRRAGLDPARDFRGADLRGVDLGNADLRGYDFSGADLRGVNFGKAKIESAVVRNSLLSDKTALPPANYSYGPFFRLESPTQTELLAWKQKETGQILGRAAPQAAFASVNAYRGSLPSNQNGIEFFTSVCPSRGAGTPYEARWYAGSVGVLVVERDGAEFAAIPVLVTKVAYRRS
jgi:hypothetical protein